MDEDTFCPKSADRKWIDSYTYWIGYDDKRDGETKGDYTNKIFTKDINTDAYEGDHFEEMTNVVKDDLQDCLKMFERLISDAEKLLYDDYTKFMRLVVVSRLYKLKSINGWIDKSFTDLLTFLKKCYRRIMLVTQLI
ncbi:hypothetical protein Lal_00027064 [Lupinus albus]|nr:hypothetical protein Lal_00027064 [Lupinus albus]